MSAAPSTMPRPVSSLPASEPSFLPFLRSFAADCVKAFEATGCEGKVEWSIVKLQSQTVARFEYTDSNGTSTYDVVVGNRYYNRNMIRVTSPDEPNAPNKVMEADSQVFLAYLTY